MTGVSPADKGLVDACCLGCRLNDDGVVISSIVGPRFASLAPARIGNPCGVMDSPIELIDMQAGMRSAATKSDATTDLNSRIYLTPAPSAAGETMIPGTEFGRTE